MLTMCLLAMPAAVQGQGQDADDQAGQQETRSTSEKAAAQSDIVVTSVEAPNPAGDAAIRPRLEDPLDRLFEDIRALLEEVDELRVRLAEAELRAAEAEREAAELRQFIQDHDEYADAWEEYRGIRELRQQEVRQRILEERREQRERERAERQARMEAIQARRSKREAEQARLQQYERAGFAPLGLDIFGGRMAFFYGTKENSDVQVEYDSIIGLYFRPGVNERKIDYSRMTISGSILNASDEVRNVGVAITFFDEHGNQVGSEIVQINNARPNVPYPFTSTLEMALNRPFNTSSTYVLYADPAVQTEVAPVSGQISKP
jgi:hypothetical protein